VIYFTLSRSQGSEPDLPSAGGPETPICDAHAPEPEKPHVAAFKPER
jgi:hypothetical protein